ncbi:hypothetical protein QTO34_003977 [Cnephaeus nilssonii]|uniref:Uncharacterized protein n=1 Tax=Cnephaeus nilssonii TaxID=3371016 RepID=A0AA40HRN7_CNENI|nr:hypothetical protein QTO34_003977 [Eptesicus nilssonii]
MQEGPSGTQGRDKKFLSRKAVIYCFDKDEENHRSLPWEDCYQCYSGDSHLGAKDCYNRMVKHFMAEFKGKHKKEISEKRADHCPCTACEHTKSTLSSSSQVSIEVE